MIWCCRKSRSCRSLWHGTEKTDNCQASLRCHKVNLVIHGPVLYLSVELALESCSAVYVHWIDGVPCQFLPLVSQALNNVMHCCVCTGLMCALFWSTPQLWHHTRKLFST
jgi:hypothetical protein